MFTTIQDETCVNLYVMFYEYVLDLAEHLNTHKYLSNFHLSS
jgi:hypothetical protein